MQQCPLKRRPAERIILRLQTSLDKTSRITRTVAVHDRKKVYGGKSGINVVEVTRFPFILETYQVSFLAKRVLVQGLLERFWLLVQALMVLSCPYSPHATLPFRCTVKHSWSILHFSGGHFVMLSI